MIKRLLKFFIFIGIFSFVTVISASFVLNLFIKSGDRVTVPELEGKDIIYALEVLTDIGLNVKIKGSEYHRSFPKNSIIYQNPEAGAEIKKDRDVKIIISKGPKSVIMPNLSGLPLNQAHIILEENGLKKGVQTKVYSDTFKQDEVITHYPSASAKIDRETKVNFLVSTGKIPEYFLMPRLEGIYFEKALSIIESKKLTLGEVQYQFYKDKPYNAVAKQSPPSGFWVAEKNVVNLEINRRDSIKKEELISKRKKIWLLTHRVSIGYLKKHIIAKTDTFGITDIIFDEFIKPNEEIYIIIPDYESTVIYLYEDDVLVKTIVYE
ncbi:MAG: PASTA domain-containing protein [Desulfobacterales bacterium]|nr:PASTA domain-containing protein [Desulfobacterales bacterium]